MLKLLPSFKDAQILKPRFPTRIRVTLTRGARRQSSPTNFTEARALADAKTPQCTFHQSFTVVRIPHAAFPESLVLFTSTLKHLLLPSPGTQSERKRDHAPIPKDPFSWKKVESPGACGQPRRGGAGEGGRWDPRGRCASPQIKNASAGMARPPGCQGALAGSAPSRPRGPPRRRGWGPATGRTLPSPPPPGVGLLRCLRGGPRSRRGAPGVPACGSPLHGQQPGTRRLFEASGSRSLRRRRSSGDRGVTLLPLPPRPPPPASPAWRSGILPSRRKRRGIAVQPARARAALRQ